MLRNLVMAAAIGALAACGTMNGNGARGSSPAEVGLGSDLRVFTNDLCLPAETAEYSDTRGLGGPLTVLGDIAVGVSGVAFKSFGRFLEESGSPRTAGSTGVTTNTFFSYKETTDGSREMNRAIRCVHIVRDGFNPRGTISYPESELGYYWQNLGLTSEPSFYALVELDPAPDRTAHFRGRMTQLVLNQMELAGTEGERDVMVFLEFSAPSSGQQFSRDARGMKQFQPGGAFAVGMIPLPRLQKDVAQTSKQLTGLQTAWMNSPTLGSDGGDFVFNLYVDVVEMKRGNRMMAEIGRMLQSEPVVSSVEAEFGNLIDGEPRRRTRSNEKIALRRQERRLIRALEDALYTLSQMQQQRVSGDQMRLTIRDVEDALINIEDQRDLDGWVSEFPEAMVRDAEAQMSSARRSAGFP